MSDERVTLTRAGIAVAIQQDLGISRLLARRLVDSIIRIMRDALAADGELKVVYFGTFSVIQKKARTGRNPKTGELHPVTARRVIGFKASKDLKRRTGTGVAPRTE